MPHLVECIGRVSKHRGCLGYESSQIILLHFVHDHIMELFPYFAFPAWRLHGCLFSHVLELKPDGHINHFAALNGFVNLIMVININEK